MIRSTKAPFDGFSLSRTGHGRGRRRRDYWLAGGVGAVLVALLAASLGAHGAVPTGPAYAYFNR